MSEKLILATPENRLFERLLTEWEKQLRAMKAPASALDQMRGYEGQLKPSTSYGVYVLCKVDGSGAPQPPFDAFIHLNHAHPKTPKPTLRLIWNRLAPRYSGAHDFVGEHSRIFSTIVGQALTLSQGPMKSKEIKIFLCNPADHAHARAFSAQLTSLPELPFNVKVRGSWLHFEWLTTTPTRSPA